MDSKKEEGMRKVKEGGSIGIILRYGDWIDVVLMLMGALGAIGDGMSTNVLLLFASRIMNSLGGSNNNNSETSMSEVEKVSF
jgi:ATP-binding cassette subfamily B (MDR/TAP) protein 1